MPLDAQSRKHFIDYVLRDVVPKTVKPRPHQAMTWFKAQFAFIGDAKLQDHLAEAFYQARYIGRVREALNLKSGFNHAFCKYQIVLYASIYEAVIDYLLDAVQGDPIVQGLLADTILQRVPTALNSRTTLTYNDGNDDHQLVPCREVTRIRKLRDIQFDRRVDAAVQLGMVPSTDSDFMKSLYKSRNNVHLQSSATREFKPDDKQSSEAFRLLFGFTKHVASWCNSRNLQIHAGEQIGQLEGSE